MPLRRRPIWKSGLSCRTGAQTIFLEQQLTIFGWHTPRFNVVSPQIEGMLYEYAGRIPLFHKAWLNE